MRINDEAKKLRKYYDPAEEAEYYAQLADNLPEEDTDSILRRAEEDYNFYRSIDKHNEAALAEWERQGFVNLETILFIPGEVGKRLVYLLNEAEFEISSFASEVGIGRTTIYRYKAGKSTPSRKTLLRIIDALSMSVADFCYAPNDFNEWKSRLEGIAISKNDIFVWKEKLLHDIVRNTFTYQCNGKTTRLPHKYYMVLKTALESSLMTLDLLPHASLPKEK